MPITALLSFIRGFLVFTLALLLVGLTVGIGYNLLNPGMKGISISDFKLIGAVITIDILVVIIIHLNIKRLR